MKLCFKISHTALVAASIAILFQVIVVSNIFAFQIKENSKQRNEHSLLLQFVMELEGVKNILRKARHLDQENITHRFDYLALTRDLDLIKNGVMQFLEESQSLQDISPPFPHGNYFQQEFSHNDKRP